jgi:hypothetical protein
MNPLGLDPARFTVACTEDGEIAGFAQLLNHNEKIAELRSMFVLEKHRFVPNLDVIECMGGQIVVHIERCVPGKTLQAIQRTFVLVGVISAISSD